MSWLALTIIVAIAVFTIASLSSGRIISFRRRDKLEAAFFRARGQRLTANGVRGNRF